MSAAMSEIAEGIVLTQDAKHRTALAVAVGGTESGFKTANAHLHIKAIRNQIIGQKTARKNFFALVLRVIKNLVCHGAQRIPLRIDGLKQGFLITHDFHNSSFYTLRPTRCTNSSAPTVPFMQLPNILACCNCCNFTLVRN